MKTLNELGAFNTQSYKGYLITFNDLHNMYFVSKDGHNIYSNPSLADVRLNIDLIN
jgi:hypothetical protein